MGKRDWKRIKRKIGRVAAVTLLFNMTIAILVFYLVLRKNDLEDFIDLFVICFVTGVCVHTFAKIASASIKEKQNRQDYILFILYCFAGPLSGSFFSCLYHYIIHEGQAFYILKSIAFYSFLFGAMIQIGLLYYFNSKKKIKDSEEKIHAEQIKRLMLEKETAMTSIKLLQAQIEPHFLFNTLSNVISLLDTDLKKAKKMLLDLNDYLRTSLQRTREGMVTLDQELTLVSRYLDILSVRMGERLTYDIETFENLSQIAFPPMILQPLVENAIKYGLEPKKEGGHIKIKCRVAQESLIISVSDNGVGLEKTQDLVGVGLDNISKRLEALYEGKAMLTVKNNNFSGVEAIVEVPL